MCWYVRNGEGGEVVGMGEDTLGCGNGEEKWCGNGEEKWWVVGRLSEGGGNSEDEEMVRE